jgi:hypothetical protein
MEIKSDAYSCLPLFSYFPACHFFFLSTLFRPSNKKMEFMSAYVLKNDIISIIIIQWLKQKENLTIACGYVGTN